MTTAPTVEDRIQTALEHYEQGVELAACLAEFEALRKDAPTDPRVIIGLGWLHILLGNKSQAMSFCRAAKNLPQGRYNMALAMLTFGEKGVRDVFLKAIEMGGHEGLHDAVHNLEDAIARRGGDFPAAKKMLAWIDEIHPAH
ncbi:MAG: hypothetical protein VKP72_06210 [bacterium]|nr:hypothetical protein [bacterium]